MRLSSFCSLRRCQEREQKTNVSCLGGFWPLTTELCYVFVRYIISVQLYYWKDEHCWLTSFRWMTSTDAIQLWLWYYSTSKIPIDHALHSILIFYAAIIVTLEFGLHWNALVASIFTRLTIYKSSCLFLSRTNIHQEFTQEFSI